MNNMNNMSNMNNNMNNINNISNMNNNMDNNMNNSMNNNMNNMNNLSNTNPYVNDMSMNNANQNNAVVNNGTQNGNNNNPYNNNPYMAGNNSSNENPVNDANINSMYSNNNNSVESVNNENSQNQSGSIQGNENPSVYFQNQQKIQENYDKSKQLYQKTVEENQTLMNNFISGNSNLPANSNSNNNNNNNDVNTNDESMFSPNLSHTSFNGAQNYQDSSFAILANSSTILDSSMISQANRSSLINPDSINNITSPIIKHQSISSVTSINDHQPSNASQNSLLISAVTNNAMMNKNPLSADVLYNQQQIIKNQGDTASISSQSSVMSGQSSIHNSPIVTATIPTSQINRLPSNSSGNTSMNSYSSPSLQPVVNTPPFISRTPSPANSLLPGRPYSPQASPSVSPLVMAAQIQSITPQSSPSLSTTQIQSITPQGSPSLNTTQIQSITPQSSPSLNTTQIIPIANEASQGNVNDNLTNKTAYIEPNIVAPTAHKHALPAIPTPPTNTTIPPAVDNGMNDDLSNNKTRSVMNTLSNMSLIYNSTYESIDLDASYSTTFLENSISQAQLPADYYPEGINSGSNTTSPTSLPDANSSKLIVDHPIDNRRISNNPFINDMVNSSGNTAISNPENNTDDNNPFNI